MKCSSCGRENIDSAKFCKYCGTKIHVEFKTCKNGHNYRANLQQCPYCPDSNISSSTVNTQSDQKTILDGETRLDPPDINPEPVTQKSATPAPDRTMMTGSTQRKEDNQHPKLIGWLVTFHFNSAGTDFRLYEGRTKVGRDSGNDIVINDITVSDDHAILLFREGKLLIQDQLSTNGTYVNDSLLDQRTELKDGDSIKLGSVSAIIKII